MDSKTRFRLIILLGFTCIVVSLGLGIGLLESLPPELQVYLEQESNKEISQIEILIIPFFILYIVSLIGIWFFKSWARSLYLIMMIALLPLYPVLGNVVMNAWEALFNDVSLIVEGVVLAVMYSGSVGEIFNENKTKQNG